MTQKNAKQKSKEYFNSHRKSWLAHRGYWRHDYRYQLKAIGRIKPDRLIDIGCGSGAFLSLVEDTFPEGNADFTSYITTATNEGVDVIFAPTSTAVLTSSASCASNKHESPRLSAVL